MLTWGHAHLECGAGGEAVAQLTSVLSQNHLSGELQAITADQKAHSNGSSLRQHKILAARCPVRTKPAPSCNTASQNAQRKHTDRQIYLLALPRTRPPAAVPTKTGSPTARKLRASPHLSRLSCRAPRPQDRSPVAHTTARGCRVFDVTHNRHVRWGVHCSSSCLALLSASSPNYRLARWGVRCRQTHVVHGLVAHPLRARGPHTATSRVGIAEGKVQRLEGLGVRPPIPSG